VAEAEGEAGGQQDAGVVHELEVQMGLGRVAGVAGEEALLVPKLALACFQTAYQRWVRDPGQDLPGLVDDGFAALARLAG
jgi:hypothetical protein